MRSPPDQAIEMAVSAGKLSPCEKSKRGCSAYTESAIGAEYGDRYQFLGAAFNSPPFPYKCDGSDACKKDCGKRCSHAEARAIRQFAHVRQPDRIRLVHIKVVDGKGVSGGGPSCWQCSRDLLDVGFGGIWLWEASGWVFYNAADFHRETLKECEIYA